MPHEKQRIDDPTRLKHIIDAANEALSFVRGKTRNDIEGDRQLTLSLVKEIEIIGEAASQITSSFKASYPAIPWSAIVSMRHRLVHGYFEIDMDVIWYTVINKLPPLLKILEKIKL